MTPTFLEKLAQHGLDAHRDALTRLGKDSIELISSHDPIVSGCSKLGGSPDLPRDFDWPAREHGPYSFLGQIRLSELPKVDTILPASGLLSFFYFQDDGSGDVSWHDPHFVRAFLFPEDLELESRPVPEGVFGAGSFRIRFERGFGLPLWPEDGADWPLDASLMMPYYDLRDSLHAGLGHLLGFSYNTSLAYDPTPGAGWSSLLTLNSESETLEFCWHDGDWLVTFVENERALHGDFSEIRTDAG